MEALKDERGVRFGHETLTFVPASAKIRPTQDHIVVEPLPIEHSETLDVAHESKPVRGIVKAVGRGHFPKRYDHPEKHKRTKYWDGKRFLPTQVKVGDVVELGGLERRGYSFLEFFWGDVLHIICAERDVAGVWN